MAAVGRPTRAALAILAALALAAPGSATLAADCHGLTGKYFFDVHNRALTKALKKRLGRSFKRFDDRNQTQVPFESTGDGFVYASACMAHSCTVDESFLGIEEATCSVYAALLEDGHYTLVLPASGWPASLEARRTAWMKK